MSQSSQAVHQGPEVEMAPAYVDANAPTIPTANELVRCQQEPIPQKLSFIWMGKKIIPPAGYVSKPGDGQFHRDTVESNVRNNRDCETVMWLDAFSMTSTYDYLPQDKAGRELARQYHDWAQLASLKQDSHIFETDRDLRDPAQFPAIAQMLRKIRSAFKTWFEPNLAALCNDASTPLGKMVAFCREIGLPFRFLDLEKYPGWMLKAPREPESQLVEWIFAELYLRGSNFGAAGDMLRTQILFEEGGMYVDHDDLICRLHNPKHFPEGDTGQHSAFISWPDYTGFKHSISEEKSEEATSGFLAAPAHHPFLAYYRDRMLLSYRRLLYYNYVWRKSNGFRISEEVLTWWDFPRGKQGDDSEWPLFAKYTINNTGPQQLENALHETSIEYMEITKERRIDGSFSNAWVNKES